jgi:hypothetical protein
VGVPLEKPVPTGSGTRSQIVTSPNVSVLDTYAQPKPCLSDSSMTIHCELACTCHIATRTVRSLCTRCQRRTSKLRPTMLTLKEPFQRTAAGPPVQPDDDFVGRIRVGRGKEPKEEFGCILRARDGQKASIGFADIEIDIRDRTAVDRVFCDLLDTPPQPRVWSSTYSSCCCSGNGVELLFPRALAQQAVLEAQHSS